MGLSQTGNQVAPQTTPVLTDVDGVSQTGNQVAPHTTPVLTGVDGVSSPTNYSSTDRR